jgi:hypothetical protein
MYELKTKLLKSDIDYKLSDEKTAMKIRWAVNSARSGDGIESLSEKAQYRGYFQNKNKQEYKK